jgi:uncharacterized protein YaeQ
MALPATRMEFKITLSHVERGLELTHALIVARHPSETLEHVALRVLGWCVLHEESLEMGPGLSDGDAPDLIARDPRGDVTLWGTCGRVPWEKLKRALSQNSGARVCALFSEERRAKDLEDELAALPRAPKELGRVEAWFFDTALVNALSSEARRQSWTVTVVDGHLYVDADGTSHDGPLTRRDLGQIWQK